MEGAKSYPHSWCNTAPSFKQSFWAGVQTTNSSLPYSSWEIFRVTKGHCGLRQESQKFLSNLSHISIKIITNFSYWQQVFLAGFVPPVAQRSTLNANQMACKKCALIQDALLFIQLLEKQDGCPSGREARKEMSSTPSYGACSTPTVDWQCSLVMSLQPIAENGKLILENSM